jgi:predicted nucleic-acid-binding protein
MVDHTDLSLQAKRRFARGGADFADRLIKRIALAHGCQATMTFDTGATKAAGMMLVA